jgi:hypothetical protein
MAKNVAEIFVETLVEAGIKRDYSVVEDSLNGLGHRVNTPLLSCALIYWTLCG